MLSGRQAGSQAPATQELLLTTTTTTGSLTSHIAWPSMASRLPIACHKQKQKDRPTNNNKSCALPHWILVTKRQLGVRSYWLLHNVWLFFVAPMQCGLCVAVTIGNLTHYFTILLLTVLGVVFHSLLHLFKATFFDNFCLIFAPTCFHFHTLLHCQQAASKAASKSIWIRTNFVCKICMYLLPFELTPVPLYRYWWSANFHMLTFRHLFHTFYSHQLYVNFNEILFAFVF